MITERCSCGAEFAADRNDELKLWREWNNRHTCPEESALQRETSATAQVEAAGQLHEPELQLGFRPTYFDDDEARTRNYK